MPDRHLSAIELRAWRDDGAGDRDRIVEHLATCADCRHAAAELERLRPPDAEPARFDPQDFVARGYSARRSPASSMRGWRPLIPLAAAAALLLAVLVPSWLARNRSEEPSLRGALQRVALVQPVGVTVKASDVAFEWKPADESGQARLNVIDLADPGVPVIQRDVTGTRYVPTADERVRLQHGRAYHWFVEYRRAGAPADTSASARFDVRE